MRQGAPAGVAEGADLLERLDRFQQARAARFARERLRGLDVDARAAEAAVDSHFKRHFPSPEENADNRPYVNYIHLHAQNIPIPKPLYSSRAPQP